MPDQPREAQSVVWCDRVPYEVVESRDEVVESLTNVLIGLGHGAYTGFVYVTPTEGNQIVLNARFISSVHPLPGCGV